MRLMENTVFHKTLLCLQSCILSYFPTGRENDKLSSTIRQPLEYLKTITLLPLPSLPKLTASRCPTSSMLCHCSKKNISLSVTLQKQGSQSRRLNRMAMEFRKTLLYTTAAPSHCSQAQRRPHSHLLHKMMGKQTFFILYRYDFDLKNPNVVYIFSLNPPKQFPKVIWNIYFTKSLLYASQRTSCRSQFSPFTMRLPRIELR